MAMLIDESGSRRVVGGTVQAAQEERDRFRQAMTRARTERAEAKGERQPVEQPQERYVVVEKGDTLTSIARDTFVSLDEAKTLNPQLDDSDHIETGEVLFLPPPSPRELAARPDGEALFLDDLYQRGNAVEYADADSVDHAAEIEAMGADVAEYLEALPTAQRGEAAQRLFDQDWTDAGPAQMAIEQGVEKLGLSLEDSSHAGADVEHNARDILDRAQAAATPEAALNAFDSAYSLAPPALQRALLRSPESRAILDNAADRVIAALDEPQNNTAGEQVPELEMFKRLDELTVNLSPAVRSELVERFLGKLDVASAQALREGENLSVGIEGMQHQLAVIERLDVNRDHDLIERFAELGLYNRNGVPQELGQGGTLAYFTALAQLSGGEESNYLLEMELLPRLEQTRNEVESHIADYETHLQDLNWLVQNGGAVMTADQLDAAIDKYLKDNPDFQTKADALRKQVADDGKDYLQQLATLESFYPELFDDANGETLAERVQAIDGDADREIAQRFVETLDDPNVSLAIRMAVESDPTLLDDPVTMRQIGQYGKLADKGRKLVEEVFTQALNQELIPKLANIDVDDPARLEKSKQVLDEFKGSKRANLLGMTDKDLSKAIDAIKESMDKIKPDGSNYQQVLKELDVKLNAFKPSKNDGIRSFSAQTIPGQALRMLGVIGQTATLGNSLSQTGDDPVYWAKAGLDAVGLTQKGIELKIGYEKMLDPSSKPLQNVEWFGGSTRLPVKILGTLSSGFDFYSAYKAGADGDIGSAALYVASGAGGITAAVGAGSMAGPIGLGVVLVATGGQMQYDKVKQANQYETATTAEFLKAAGFNDNAAKALADQSGDGYNVLPLLARYADYKELDLKDAADQGRFRDWINNMPADDLAALRDNIHRVLDQQDNDVANFPASNDEDDQRYAEGLSTLDPRYNTSRTVEQGQSYPRSFVQLDMALDVLGVEALS